MTNAVRNKEIEDFFDALWVPNPGLVDFENRIDEVMSTDIHATKGSHMLIAGHADMGKTHFGKRIVTKYQCVRTPEREIRPVVMVKLLGDNQRLAGLLPSLLRELKAFPSELKGNNGDRIHALINRIQKSGTRLVIIDEAQHIIRKSADADGVANALKSFVEAAGVHVLFLAKPAILALLARDDQINVRLTKRTVLAPFSQEQEQFDAFRKMLFQFGKAIAPLMGAETPLAANVFAMRLLKMSCGRPGRLAAAIKAACKVAAESGESQLCGEHFQVGAKKYDNALRRYDGDPFCMDDDAVEKMPLEPTGGEDIVMTGEGPVSIYTGRPENLSSRRRRAS